jgi:hypothetical protein
MLLSKLHKICTCLRFSATAININSHISLLSIDESNVRYRIVFARSKSENLAE